MTTVWHTLKVFISSTFRDMELARDQLALTFRNIQQAVQERQLAIRPYDLRWRDRDSQQHIVDWCVSMVERCPYFVGILGSRYGYRPPCGPGKVPNTQRLSVTEIEIQQALQKVAKERRFFCFGTLSASITESLEDLRAVENLKQRLKQSGETIFYFKTIPELLEIVSREFRHVVDAEFPQGQKVAPKTANYLEALGEIVSEKVQGFVGRERYLARLRRFSQDQKRPNYLGIYGIAGTGKSALVARFIEEARSQKLPVVAHFISMSSSRELREVIQSLAAQLQALGFLPELPLENLELQNQVRQALQKTQNLLLILDGLDELDEGQELKWLSQDLPPSVRVILTSRPVKVLDTLKNFPHIEMMELPPLEGEEVQAVISDYAGRHNLQLTQSDLKLLERQTAGNPLYLKVALEELVAGGTAIAQLAKTIEDLFEQILGRLGREQSNQVLEDYLGLLAAKKSGTLEEELEEIMGISEEAVFSLRQALRSFLIVRGGLLHFFHPEFERSVKIRLGKAGVRKYHSRWANYLVEKGYGYIRTIEELPYQLQWAERHEELLKVLCDLNFLEQKLATGMLVELREDLERAIGDPVVGLPKLARAEPMRRIEVEPQTLFLIMRVIEKEAVFLLRRPQALFQSLWNLMFWHDSPEASRYYQKSEKGEEMPPWQASGTKMYPLAELWRKSQNKPWLKTLRPLPLPLVTSLLQIFQGHEAEVTTVAFSPDGARIASGSRDKTVRVWRMPSGILAGVYNDHEAGVESVCFSADGSKLAAGAEDRTVLVWNINNGELLGLLTGPQAAIRSVAFSPDSAYLAAGADDGNVYIWAYPEGKLVQTLAASQNMITSLSFSADGNKIATAGYDCTIRVWEVKTGLLLATCQGHDNVVYSVNFGRDSKLVSGGQDGTLRLWDATNGQATDLIKTNAKTVYSVQFNPDSSKVAAGTDQTIRVWDVASKSLITSFRGHEGPVTSVQFSPDGSKMLSGSEDATVRLWDMWSGLLLPSPLGHTNIVFCLAASPDRKQLASGAKDTTVKIWDAQTGMVLHTLPEHGRAVYAVCFSGDGKIIASGANDQTVRLWDAKNGILLKNFQAKEGTPKSLCFNAQGAQIACGFYKTILILDSQSGRNIASLRGHDSSVISLCFNGATSQLASGSTDRTVRVWDAASNTLLYVLTGHNDAVFQVCFSPDGTKLASASKDNTVRLWDMANGQCIQTVVACSDACAIAMGLPHYPGIEDGLTIIRDAIGRPLACFPVAIEHASISRKGLVTGFSGNYVYLLQMC